MKVIAMYLPQFHRVKENDEWWGEGFTEWTAVKEAKPLFEGHYQPKVPLNRNYYNLLQKGTMEWQASIMKRYNIYGMCFYHYWFKDGRRILEKPAENLLKWMDIEMPFCFSWANESWARTWSKLGDKNVWTEKFEKFDESDMNSMGVLLEQNYGGEKEWKEHFNYLMPFFKDKRYIKIDNKPVFIFYKPQTIYCMEEMINCWTNLALESGLEGLYFIGTNMAKRNSLDAVLIQEPWYTLLRSHDTKIVTNQNKEVAKYIDGERLWDIILGREFEKNVKIYLGGFTGFDDTPRRGEGGTVVKDIPSDIFYNKLVDLFYKNESRGNAITFINAWNEWGEGMYLEPDEANQFRYLEAVKQAVENYKTKGTLYKDDEKKVNSDFLVERYRSYWKILNDWLTLKERNGRLDSYLLRKKYSQIALYGIGMVGLHLIKELEGSSVTIKYGIDQRGNNIHQAFPVYKKEEKLPEVDAIIVSVTYEYGEIYEYLKNRMKCPIISLEEVVEESLIING